MNEENIIKEFVFAKSQFSFFASDPSFKIVRCKCANQEFTLTFIYKKFQFTLESDRTHLQLIVSPLSHVEEKYDLGNLLGYIHNVIENKPQTERVNEWRGYESNEIQLERLAGAVRENFPQIELFCDEKSYLENCRRLGNYIIETYPQYFKGLKPS